VFYIAGVKGHGAAVLVHRAPINAPGRIIFEQLLTFGVLVEAAEYR
jgi:hypothetical protein